MIDIQPFRTGHMTDFAVQNVQRIEISPEGVKALEHQHAFTAFAGSRPVLIAGLAEQWAGRALAWALVSRLAGAHMTALVRVMRRALDTAPYDRVEATVLRSFAPGIRLVDMLGFQLEAPVLRKYRGDRDYALFARVRHVV